MTNNLWVDLQIMALASEYFDLKIDILGYKTHERLELENPPNNYWFLKTLMKGKSELNLTFVSSINIYSELVTLIFLFKFVLL